MHCLASPNEIGRAPSERTAQSAPGGRPRIRGGIVEGRDGEAVAHLAALSGHTPPQGAVLFAELCGQPVAAVGVFDGNVVADRARFGLALRLRLRAERLFVRAVIALAGI